MIREGLSTCQTAFFLLITINFQIQATFFPPGVIINEVYGYGS